MIPKRTNLIISFASSILLESPRAMRSLSPATIKSVTPIVPMRAIAKLITLAPNISIGEPSISLLKYSEFWPSTWRYVFTLNVASVFILWFGQIVEGCCEWLLLR